MTFSRSGAGRVFYVITDSGTTAPPDGIIRQADLLRVELHRQATSSVKEDS